MILNDSKTATPSSQLLLRFAPYKRWWQWELILCILPPSFGWGHQCMCVQDAAYYFGPGQKTMEYEGFMCALIETTVINCPFLDRPDSFAPWTLKLAVTLWVHFMSTWPFAASFWLQTSIGIIDSIKNHNAPGTMGFTSFALLGPGCTLLAIIWAIRFKVRCGV